ncbi:hypothetical protein H2O64_08500 [Kordia sp. YSTF-M3]|uniref:Uncharacterized protein n=1 Tax=Kordia aestuariivivens TaxID=2759037 RepID=A0ABR7Q890_9FLAO|nr:hypothetical protein [Kordia aestuariivivens]MBC8754708.1 hypothetical protein [Kordia aestuariivivens]
MKNAVYLLGFLAFFTLSTGIMFEFFHWPYSGKLMLLGFVLLNLGFLPTLFYKLYKIQKIA